ncbi:MAG: cytochrome P450, partial [Chitinophagales bacterium]
MEALTKQSLSAPEADKQPLIGSLYYFFKDPYEFLLSNSRKYESVYKVSNPLRKVYVAHHPDAIKHVLQDNNKNYHKSFAYRILKILLGNGLLTSEGDFWRKQRRLAQPAFHRQRLANLFDLMLDFSTELADDLERQIDSKAVNIAPQMMEVTLKVVSKSLFSSDVDVHVSKVSSSLDVVLESAMNRIRNPLHPPRWIPIPANIKENKAVDALNEVVRGIISSRRKSGEQKDDLLGMLMEAKDEETGEQMNDQQLVDECMTIFLAGHETSAVAMSWLLYCLAQNPDKCDKLYLEIDRVLEGRKPGIADLPQLSYTKMVVDEALRLYPPAWVIGRRSLGTDNIMGYDLPDDANV